MRGPTESVVWRGAAISDSESGYAPVFTFMGWAFPNALRILYWVVLVPAELSALLWLAALLEKMDGVQLGISVMTTISFMLLLPILLRIVHDTALLMFTIGVAWLRLIERRTWG